MDIISIFIAFVSLCISFASWCISFVVARGVAPVIHKSGIDVTVHGDGIDLLFSEDGNPRNEQVIRMVNKNNRDILVFLRSGYICNDTKKYYLKPEYYKLLANDVTTIRIKVDITKSDKLQEKDYKYMFVFECPGLFFNRKKKCKEKW